MNGFQSNSLNIYGEKGKAWLDELPELVTAIASRLDLRDLKEVTNLTYNYVLSGFRGDNPIILKLGLDNANLKQEAFALKCFAGYGAVKVLAEDEGVLLLERSVPGASLKSYFPDKEQESIEIVCGVMKKLHQASIPEGHNFPHIKDWLKALDKDWNIPNHYLQKARQLRDQLLKTAALDVLLHGDLHHDNILQNGENWLVIDPKGVIGESAYEVAAFIRNPMPELLTHADAPTIIHNRITRFAELLELPSQRILNWCFVQAVLVWVWALEDGCDIGYWERLVEVLHSCHIS
ncbi:MAG: streptomycin phosphotransferase [Gammaproteobacteria bacterium]|nr:streptomycin phosphotransferase [Gammaproteobacteria bacterium]